MPQWPPALLEGGSVVAIAREEVDFNIFTLHELFGLSNQRLGGLCSQECLEQPTVFEVVYYRAQVLALGE